MKRVSEKCQDYLVLIIVGCIAFGSATICHSRLRSTPKHAKESALALPYKVRCASDAGIATLEKRLRRQGVTLLSVGQDYLVSIPSAKLFSDQTPRIYWGSYKLLNQVVCYLRQYRKVAVEVTTHSSKYISPRREWALTEARSKVVADYLWSQGIDSRFIFTRGLGSDKPIVAGQQFGDTSPNARVEIVFRRAII